MTGHSQFLLAATLTATALISAPGLHAHTGNQMYETFAALTGSSPERSEPHVHYSEATLKHQLPQPAPLVVQDANSQTAHAAPQTLQ